MGGEEARERMHRDSLERERRIAEENERNSQKEKRKRIELEIENESIKNCG